jgi:hypothetical protein
MKIGDRVKEYLPPSWRYRIELKRARAAEAALNASSPADTQEAYESGAIHSYLVEMSDAHQWRRTLITAEYRRRAEALSVPFPAYQDNVFWEEVENELTQQSIRCLSAQGESLVKAAIREEQKHRREAVGYWFTLVLGLIGAITGLVSVFKG